jgi:hypothetical protein
MHLICTTDNENGLIPPLELCAPNDSRSRCLGLWLTQRITPDTIPNLPVPHADAREQGDTGSAKESEAKCSQRRSCSCSARKEKPNQLVDDRKQN